MDLEGNIFRENLIADTCVLYSVGSSGNLVKIDNQYLTCGIYQYCDSIFDGGVGSLGMVYKFSEEGDTIWTKNSIANLIQLFIGGTNQK